MFEQQPAGARFLARLAKSARKHWCALTVVTQDAGDLLATDLGQAVVANAATQVLLGQAPQAIDRLTTAYDRGLLSESDVDTAVRHILPNISSLLIIDATLNVGAAILAETGLSFFGFGVQPPDTSLGTLLGAGARQINSFPWLFTGPAVIVVVLVLSVNAVGDGLRDALDPASASSGSAR